MQHLVIICFYVETTSEANEPQCKDQHIITNLIFNILYNTVEGKKTKYTYFCSKIIILSIQFSKFKLWIDFTSTMLKTAVNTFTLSIYTYL